MPRLQVAILQLLRPCQPIDIYVTFLTSTIGFYLFGNIEGPVTSPVQNPAPKRQEKYYWVGEVGDQINIVLQRPERSRYVPEIDPLTKSIQRAGKRNTSRLTSLLTLSH